WKDDTVPDLMVAQVREAPHVERELPRRQGCTDPDAKQRMRGRCQTGVGRVFGFEPERRAVPRIPWQRDRRAIALIDGTPVDGEASHVHLGHVRQELA